MSVEQLQDFSTVLEPWEPQKIDKSLPRPAPTKAYSWKEYNSLAKLLYIRDHKQANDELSKLDATVLGFDLEWKPNFYRGNKENRVALVQLANDDTILLLQISAMQGRFSNQCYCHFQLHDCNHSFSYIEFPSKLVEILANSDIIKAGVAIQS